MGVFSSPSIPLDGLVFSIDAGNAKSYSGSGTNVNDSINGITGTLTNGVAYTSNIGGYFSFDGVDDRISYPLTSILDISQSITTECYIRPLNYQSGANGGTMLISKAGCYYLEFANNGKIRVYFYGLSSEGYHESTNTIPLNVWSHIVATRDHINNTISIYINGVLDRNLTSITGNIRVQQSFSLGIGGYNGTGYSFIGHIAYGRIYNRALTAAEVLQLYNASKDRFIYREEYTKSNLLLNFDFQSNNSYTSGDTRIVDLANGLGITLSQTSYLTYSSTSPKSLRFGRTMPPTSLNGAYCSILIPGGSLSYPIYLGNDHTTEIWFKINDINPTNNDATEVCSSLIVYQGYHNMFYYSNTTFFYNVWYKQAGVNYPISAEVTVGNSNAEILPNVWYQALATKTSSIIKLYINGSLKATAAIPYTTISDQVTNYLNISTAVPLPSGTAYRFKADCTISAIRMYNRALTPLEVSYNFNALRGRFGI